MRKLLVPLLAAIAFPAAVNAEIINLECTETYEEWRERIDYKEEEMSKIYIDIDTKRQSATIDDGNGFIKKYNTFITRDLYLLTFINTSNKTKESFDISRVNGSYLYKQEQLQYDPESAYFDQGKYDVVMGDMEKFGDILKPLKKGGSCKKAKKIKTIF